MDAATIQQKINTGLGNAALRTAFPFDVYRPVDGTNPLAAGNLVVSGLNAGFLPGQTGYAFSKVGAYKDALFVGMFNATQNQVGDYLTATPDGGGQGTYFIAAMPALQPVLTVFCNCTLTLSTPGPPGTFGAQDGYMGTTPANETAVMTTFPANAQYEARGRASGSNVGLPLDAPSPYFTILLPRIAGIDVRPSMIVTDEVGRRYVINGSEHSPLGWRVWAQHEVT